MRNGLASTLLLCMACLGHQAGVLSAETTELGVRPSLTKDATTVAIDCGKRRVLLYRYGDVPYKPYVKELYTPGGTQILRDSPVNHVHHRGLMYGLDVDGEDFWSELPVAGKQNDAGVSSQQSSEQAEPHTMAFTQQLRWTPRDATQPLLLERRTITAHCDPQLGATLLTWQSQFEPGPGRASCELTGSHYDGLGMRFVESMDGQDRFVFADGTEIGPVIRGTNRVTSARWVALRSEAGGKSVTVALFDHPGNPRKPAGMFTMHEPFAYLSATPNVSNRPLTLQQGQTLALRYGAAVWDGQIDSSAIDQLYDRWVELSAAGGDDPPPSTAPPPEKEPEGREQADASAARPNVLLICVDDLRPELGCYGSDNVITPNFDRLAAEGRRFTRHYVQSAVCGPSRCSLLTGQRILSSWDCWRQQREGPEDPLHPVSFAQLLRGDGYRTVCIGKISHLPGGVMDPEQQVHQVPFSWDLAYAPVGKWQDPWGAFFCYADGSVREYGYGRNRADTPAFERAAVPDEGYADGLNAEEAIKQLRDLRQRGGPFLLAVGFYKPHLPHNAPKKYWDLYDPQKIGLAPNRSAPKDAVPEISLHRSFELTTHYAWPGGEGHITDEQARNQRHAYFACVSYIDAQLGKVLDELRRLGLHRNTVVVLWSDHGWHLGEHGIFGKQTNYEIATRSPLIIRAPDMPWAGRPTDGIVETVDLYPTLCQLCEVDPPKGLAGRSLAPMLLDPTQPGKQAALSFFARGPYRGWALRTDRYRLIRWVDGRTDQVALAELYDHESDPQENLNIASQRPQLVERLTAQLHDFIKQSNPQDRATSLLRKPPAYPAGGGLVEVLAN